MSSDSVQLPALTNEEDTFAMAVIEYGGNLPAAYRSVWGDVAAPGAKAQRLISRPEIAKRIKQLSDATQEHSLISLGSHLQQLAQIRDQAIVLQQMKPALDAEIARGTVAGFYKKAEAPQGNGQPQVIINMNNAGTPTDVTEWSTQFGKAPITIEMDRSK